MSCGVGPRHCSDLALLGLWRRSAVTAPIRPLAWEFPYAKSAGLKRQTKTKKQTKQKNKQTKKNKKKKKKKKKKPQTNKKKQSTLLVLIQLMFQLPMIILHILRSLVLCSEQ